MKCDIKIMASPKRYAYVLNMCKILGLDIDQDVFFDDRPNGGNAAYTSEHTWMLPFADNSITHRCVLQDDVICCKNFPAVLDALVERKPNAMFSLFCSQSSMLDIYNKSGAQFVEILRGGMYGQAIIMPRDVISLVYDWGRTQAAPKPVLHDDVLIGEFALAHQISIYTTVPSLIQHLCPTQSLLGYNNKKKVSKVFDMDAPALVDWMSVDDSRHVSIPNSTNFF